MPRAACALAVGEGDKRRACVYDKRRWPHPTTKSSSKTPDAPASDSPPVVGTRSVDIVVYLLLLALAALLGFDNWRTGMGWAPDGPQAGYFPFYLSRHPGRRQRSMASSARSSRGAAADEPFVTRDQLRRVMQVFVPTLLFCLFTQWLGLYVASFLLIAGFMRVRRTHRAGGSRCSRRSCSRSPCSSPSRSPSTSSCRKGRSKRLFGY